MAVTSAAAYGLYSKDVALADVVHTLNQAGFDKEDICMMLAPSHPIACIVREASLFSSERQENAATAGMIGWLSAFGAVLIPGVGFFIRSQAFLHALMATREAPALCGNAQTLIGLGFSEGDAQKYEDQRVFSAAMQTPGQKQGSKSIQDERQLRVYFERRKSMSSPTP